MEQRRDLYGTGRRGLEQRQYINPAALWNRLREMGRDLTWLAREMGVDPQTVHNYLGGGKRVPHSRADQIAEVLSLPASSLLSPNPPPRVTAAARGEKRGLLYANAEVIRAEMERRGWNKTDLARAAGFSPSTARKALEGTGPLRREVQEQLTRVLGRPRSEVMEMEPVDPALDSATRTLETPTPYGVRRLVGKRAQMVIRSPQALEPGTLMDRPSQADLPCGCVVYWSGSSRPTPEAMEEIDEHYRRHLAGLMEEPGRIEDRPRRRTPSMLPVPSPLRARMMWPRLPDADENGPVMP